MMISKSENKSMVKKLLALLLCCVLVVMTMTSCGSPSTLEEYVADNAEVADQIDSVAASSGMEIEIKDNTLTYIYKYDTTYTAEQVDYMKGIMDSALDNMASTFESLGTQLEDETGIDGIVIKVLYQNGDGSAILEKDFE